MDERPITWREITVLSVVALWAWSIGVGMGTYITKIGLLETQIGKSK